MRTISYFLEEVSWFDLWVSCIIQKLYNFARKSHFAFFFFYIDMITYEAMTHFYIFIIDVYFKWFEML